MLKSDPTQFDSPAQLAHLRDFLETHLLQSIVPFWLSNAIDPDGGINTCISDGGVVINRDKWLWSQWRAVWVFAKLHNTFGPNSDWLQAATQIQQFCTKHGWDESAGAWRLRIGSDGKVLDACESIYVDAFAIYGLTELAKATGNDEYVALACKTADSAIIRLREPHDQIPHRPYPVPKGARVHGLPMIFSLVFWELGELLHDTSYRGQALDCVGDIFQHFYRIERDVVLERIASDNGEYPAPLGTAILPGHVLEGMWFQIHIARDMGDDRWISWACRMIRRHFELGWDNEYGGIYLARDADGSEEIGWQFPTMKVWWPQVEAMYALLLAYEHSGDQYFINAYNQVHQFCFCHFPLSGQQEWRQNLDRTGSPIDAVPCLPVKDPFHLPRSLIYCVDVLGRLAAD